jgi:hypothetical protein
MTGPTFDAREGSGDPETDPAAMGEVSAEVHDGDGGAVVEPEDGDSPAGHPS